LLQRKTNLFCFLFWLSFSLLRRNCRWPNRCLYWN
jgi:hypothetical protein